MVSKFHKCSRLMSVWNWTVSSGCMHEHILVYLPTHFRSDPRLHTYIYVVDLIRVIRPPLLWYMCICCGLMPWSGLLTAMFINPSFHICICVCYFIALARIHMCIWIYIHTWLILVFHHIDSCVLMTYVCMGNFRSSFFFASR